MQTLTKHSYLITFELPEHPEENKRKSWVVVQTHEPIITTEHVQKVLGHILNLTEANPPIFPINISHLATYNVEVPKTILLYQMGKVGSMSLRKILEDQGFDVRHIHYFYSKGEYQARNGLDSYRAALENDGRLNVITIVRNPIDRAVSAFLWNLGIYFKGNTQEFTKELLEAFIEEYPHDWTFRWFDEELHRTLNYNVLQEYFDRERGYHFYSRDDGDPKFKLMVIRTENLISDGPQALKEFLDINVQEMLHVNKTGIRLSSLYIPFHQNAVLPNDILDLYLDHPFTRHFYLDDEIALLRKKWSSPPWERMAMSAKG